MLRIVSALLALTMLMTFPFAAEQGVPREERFVYQMTRQANARVVLDAVEAHMNEPGTRSVALVAAGGGVRAMLGGAVDTKGESYEPALRRLMARGVDVIVCVSSLDKQQLDPSRVVMGRVVPAGRGEVERLLGLGYRELQ